MIAAPNRATVLGAKYFSDNHQEFPDTQNCGDYRLDNRATPAV